MTMTFMPAWQREFQQWAVTWAVEHPIPAAVAAGAVAVGIGVICWALLRRADSDDKQGDLK